MTLTPEEQEEYWAAVDFFDPAWWRGNDKGIAGLTYRLQQTVDGHDDDLAGVTGYAPLEKLRRDIVALRKAKDTAEARAAAAEAQAARLAEVVQAVLRRADAEQAVVAAGRDRSLGWERRHHAAAVELSAAKRAERAALAAYRQQQEAQS